MDHLQGALHYELHPRIVRMIEVPIPDFLGYRADNAVVDGHAGRQAPNDSSIYVLHSKSIFGHGAKPLCPGECTREDTGSDVLPLELPVGVMP